MCISLLGCHQFLNFPNVVISAEFTVLNQARTDSRILTIIMQSQSGKVKYTPNEQIYHTSFYKQVKNQREFSSLECAKEYLHDSKYSSILENILPKMLQANHLPHNPYNLIFRLVGNQAASISYFEYHQGKPQLTFPERSPLTQMIHKVEVNGRQYHINSSLLLFVDPASLDAAFNLIYSHRNAQITSKLANQYGFTQVMKSFGGPFVLDLCSSGEDRVAPHSIYSEEAMLTVTEYLVSQAPQTKAFDHFAQFILDDINQEMQYADEVYLGHFEKLQLLHYEQDRPLLLQFGRENVIKNRAKIQKEMKGSLENYNLIIQSRSIYRLCQPTDEQFISVKKRYVLIVLGKEEEINIVSNDPIGCALREVFIQESYLRMVLHDEERQVNMLYKEEAISKILYYWREQCLTELGWELFYFFLRFQSPSEQTAQVELALRENLEAPLTYLLFEPLQRVIHQIKCTKLMLSSKFPSQSEEDAFTIMDKIDGWLSTSIQRREFVTFQHRLYLQILKNMSEIFLETKHLKINPFHQTLTHILDQMLMILSGVVCTHEQIKFNLDGSMQAAIDYILQKYNGKNTVSNEYLNFEKYLKRCKKLPQKMIDVEQEINMHKQRYSLSSSQMREVVYCKYLQTFRLYETIYNSYLQIICAKKVPFPLVDFLFKIMPLAVQFSSQKIKPSKGTSIAKNTLSQVDVYQIISIENGLAFYALHSQALALPPLKEYKIIIDTLSKYFRTDVQEQNKATSLKMVFSVRNIPEQATSQVYSFNSSKIYVDFFISSALQIKPAALHVVIYEQAMRIVGKMDEDNIAIIGFFPVGQFDEGTVSFDDELLSKFISENGAMLRYDYKRGIPFEKFSRMLEFCSVNQKQLEIRILFTLREVVKSCRISLNFYYSVLGNKSQLKPYLKSIGRDHRVFPSKSDLVEWELLYRSNTEKYSKNSTEKKGSKPMMWEENIRRIVEGQGLSVVSLIAQQNKERGGFSASRLSKFPALLSQSEDLVTNMYYLIQTFKTDRRGRYESRHLRKIHELLRYFLEEQCLKSDQYVFSEGLSVCMINHMGSIDHYLVNHEDNSGDEKQLLQLEKTVKKLSKCLKFAKICCRSCCQIL